ncbi:hypothetical protein EN851_07635 [Mesorhizobium sp. M8A.F.Ca.ET.208.01.1.1]|nr:hypothetical protein EN851_07635 [Mesorhizobium sp. M8A.F.Ca.ET.208.01.1.1]TGT56484.1 hypothetical protein EN810_07635 [Mesorhizobium sp. M8A.F.Ca.ET.167.01.1.1]
MSEAHLDPAKSIIAKIGIDNVAKVTGKHVSRVYRWMSPKERGGTGGLIPQAAQPAILKFAVENSIDLAPADFFPVSEAAE